LDKLRADRESSALLKGGDADEIKGGAFVECEENSENGEELLKKAQEREREVQVKKQEGKKIMQKYVTKTPHK
jgi:hypothetical protein